MCIDTTRKEIYWWAPSGKREHGIALSAILHVQVLDKEHHEFSVADAKRIFEFRATCGEAMEAWLTLLASCCPNLPTGVDWEIATGDGAGPSPR